MAAKKLRVLTSGTRRYIHVHPGRGAELSRYLRSHGVLCSPPQPSSEGVNSIEVAPSVDVHIVQGLLNGWV